jgi:hypothetical protein
LVKRLRAVSLLTHYTAQGTPLGFVPASTIRLPRPHRQGILAGVAKLS